MTMMSMTYGTLPTREQFDAAFEAECPNGYRISLGRSDSRAVDGFKLGDGTWTASELWDAVNEIVHYEGDNGEDTDTDKMYAAMDLVSSIMETLGFEWI